MKALNPERVAAIRAIRQATQGRHLQEALANVFAKSAMTFSQKAQASDLAYGYFRTRLRLVLTLEKVLPGLQNLPKDLRLALSLAAYSLLFQDRGAIYAIFNQTVEYAKRKFGQKLAGVTNGALRSLQRLGKEVDKQDFFAPESGDDRIWHGLATFYAMPYEIACLWRKSYGEAAALNLLKRSFQRPRTGIILNPYHEAFKELKDAFTKTGAGCAFPLGDSGFALAPGNTPQTLCGRDVREWQRLGALDFMAAGSQQVLLELGLEHWKGPVWDCCAGVGGKTKALTFMGATVALASDVSAKRLERFRPQGSTLVVRASAAYPPLVSWKGDILADVPCSGLGVLSRRPDIREAWQTGNPSFGQFVQIQKDILRGAAGTLLPGRELAYLTCTLNPAENEAQIQAFLQEKRDFSLIKEWQTPANHPWLEGMYGALLRKN